MREMINNPIEMGKTGLSRVQSDPRRGIESFFDRVMEEANVLILLILLIYIILLLGGLHSSGIVQRLHELA